MDNNNGKDSLTYNILQLAIFIVILGLIIFRFLKYEIQTNSWIWIINYIGMAIAFINLFINKCFELKSLQNKKYKPFVGFTICMLILVFLLYIPVYQIQNSEYSQTINDVITLLALFFSLSHTIWDSILDSIVKILKV